MSRRVTQVVLLCEDRQHEAFARRFLERQGVGRRQIRVERSPTGRGSGEQWVRRAYAREVQAFRSANYIQSRALIVMIDEDTSSTIDRQQTLECALDDAKLPRRGDGERIIHVLPARNIETWLAYLSGEDVNEGKTYPKLAQERRCAEQVKELHQMCAKGELRQPAPRSLGHACEEFQTRFQS